MLITTFPPQFIINSIVNELPADTCGTASACIVFKKLELPYDHNEFIKNGRDGAPTKDYPVPGSNVFGTALAIAKTNLVDVKIYIDFDIDKEYDTLEEYEKDIIEEIKLLSNITISPSISIEEIEAKMNDSCIPILAFDKDGDSHKRHFSPFRGLSAGDYLILPLESNGSCNCSKDEFVKNWWNDYNCRPCILVCKK